MCYLAIETTLNRNGTSQNKDILNNNVFLEKTSSRKKHLEFSFGQKILRKKRKVTSNVARSRVLWNFLIVMLELFICSGKFNLFLDDTYCYYYNSWEKRGNMLVVMFWRRKGGRGRVAKTEQMRKARKNMERSSLLK